MRELISILQLILIYSIPILFAITVHEVAHGWVANKLGDATAKIMGRLTLNPLRHIDLVGTVLVPLLLVTLSGFIFGWAKPVPVTWSNLKHPRRDAALVAIAGPISNFMMAAMWAVILKVGGFFPAVVKMAEIGIYINLILLVLNLVPIPPLDGSRVVSSLLPRRLANKYDSIGVFGFLILLLLLVSGVLGNVLLPVVNFLRWMFLSF
ncbi:MAG: site-2 protease family protein [Gammaproteobacteria bacterium]